jgi:TetR/AcrR family transcriptional regulator, ethionamide resistance regulator
VHPGDEGRKGPARRRRRTPEVAEREIIAAAEAFLRERPFRELTVDEVMRRTELSRPSFYVYFTDRHQLVLRVVEHLGAELFAMSDRWLRGTGEGPELAREALEGVVQVYADHGPVMRALADAASDDPGVEQAYNAIVQAFVDATARHIEDEIAAGRILQLDARETARALVWMMERYLNLSLGRDPQTSREAVSEALTTIWTRVLYGVSDRSSAGSAGGA